MSERQALVSRGPGGSCYICEQLVYAQDFSSPRWTVGPPYAPATRLCGIHLESVVIDALAAFDSGPLTSHELLVLITAIRTICGSAGKRQGWEFAESLSLSLMALAGEMGGG